MYVTSKTKLYSPTGPWECSTTMLLLLLLLLLPCLSALEPSLVEENTALLHESLQHGHTRQYLLKGLTPG